MGWLSLLKLLLGAADKLTGYLANKQLLNAGEAIQLSKNLKMGSRRVKKAIYARRNVVVDADGDGVPDPDKHSRD